MTRKHDCTVCGALPPGDLVELDLILADPSRWPETVWNGMDPPQGALPASFRRFGAMEMGMRWLETHREYAISKAQLRRHLRFDVPVLEIDAEALIQRGVLAAGGRSDRGLAAPIDPLEFVGLYNDGVKVGRTALKLLEQRIQALVDRGEEVPLPVIKLAMEAGIKLAMSQAAIKAAGKRFDDDGKDEIDAFRTGGDEEQPSIRVGHHRVRTIEGERRVVADAGPADRAQYNEAARKQGNATIGGR